MTSRRPPARPSEPSRLQTLTDPLAERVPAPEGADRPATPRRVLVAGGGIAGLAATTGLVERGVQVELVEPHETLGGRVRSWTVEESGQTWSMGRGFHAFFRQYYNLRSLLGRLPEGPAEPLVPVPDYPLVSSDGLQDSFARIPRTPPFSFLGFVLRSPSFRLRDLPGVDPETALSLLDVEFPGTFAEHDGQSAQEFLDRLGFPDRARHLALEVFARSFFASPREFSAGELVAMFHTYFLGSAEGLLFDTASDDFDTALWAPLGKVLEEQGVLRRRTMVEALRLEDAEPGGVVARLGDGTEHHYDAVVLATGPEPLRRLAESVEGIEDVAWRHSLRHLRTAPPFAVWRLWLDRPVDADRPAFVGTAQFGPLDNISRLELFEATAARWSAEHDGASVVELHAYALPEDGDDEAGNHGALKTRLLEEASRVWPELRRARIEHDELLVEQDCPLVGTEPWAERPGVRTPDPRLVLAGDAICCEDPVALMERAATTGWMAANALLEHWSVRGHELWTPPTTARQPWPGFLRGLLRRTAAGASA